MNFTLKNIPLYFLIIFFFNACSKEDDTETITEEFGEIEVVVTFNEGYDKMYSLRMITYGVRDGEDMIPRFIPVTYLNTGIDYDDSGFIEEQFEDTIHSFRTTEDSKRFNYGIVLRSELQDPFQVDYSVEFYFNGELVHTHSFSESNITQSINEIGGWSSTEGFYQSSSIIL
ncbi:hypothetical protein [Zobellia laminariae]|uniref:hypothetical protein n=1 Tax=Zobellia laminariae TaxID=248906 RepID=UPI0026F4644D|nr:hypothetical protein [Zobellia laminariae]WKX76705.1 hypothetical protein Q5W13_00560 [Zobellia laminariae]